MLASGEGNARSRPGFALFVVILMVAMLAVAGTIIATSLASTNSRKSAQAALDELNVIVLRIPPFKTQIALYPGRLSQLTAPIIVDASCVAPGYCDVDSCQSPFSSTKPVKWNDNNSSYGPYLTHRLIVKDYGYPLPGGFGFLKDIIYRATAPPTPTNAGGNPVWVDIRDVEEPDAKELDLLKDGTGANAGSAAGNVRWSAVVDGRVTVYYMLAANGVWSGC